MKTFGPHKYRNTRHKYGHTHTISCHQRRAYYIKYCTSKAYYICPCMSKQHFGKIYNICDNPDLISCTELCHYSFGAFAVVWLLVPSCDPSCSSHITLAKHAQLTNHHIEKKNPLYLVCEHARDERSVLPSYLIIENTVGCDTTD